MNNFCQECGSPRSENAKFCANCGFKFHQEAEEEVKSDSEIESQKEVEIQECVEITQVENSIPQESKKVPQTPKIGGWLDLFAIGLIFNTATTILFPSLTVFSKKNIIDTIINNPFDMSFITYCILMAFFSCFGVLLFFSKNKNTKIFMLIYFILCLFGVIFSKGKGFLWCIIWFFYFLFSKRVKQTFISQHTKKDIFIKVFISLIFPLIFLLSLAINYPSEQEISQARKRNLADLHPIALSLYDKEILLKEFIQQKDIIIRNEVDFFSTLYSFNKHFKTGAETIKYINQNMQNKNLIKGILYFCGKKCSPIKQDFHKSYDYFNNLDMQEKQEIFMILAEMNLYGIGVEQNLTSAVKNASQAKVSNEYGKAMQYYYLALGYLYGAYFQKDIQKAIECFKKSADLGNPSSALLVALFMATEPKGKYNQQTIIHYFEKAILLNNSMAELWLAYYYYNNNEDNMAKNTLLNCSKTNSECEKAYQELFK
ncbi:DUF2569 family protein [Helicobacter brantae]|uniref:beta-lactamase n=1 Tax=Helicobacter brantae TaxID=375927 RepID=A0A3D8J3Q9_9HELI|nr:DUF2569 family protein [Helicobacter brantae]RDU71866.1 hypothetical protein CQA58_02145 [Helicobacter brantae]